MSDRDARMERAEQLPGSDTPAGKGGETVLRFDRSDGGVNVVDPAAPAVIRIEYSDGAEIVTQEAGTITYLNTSNGEQWSFDGHTYSYSDQRTPLATSYISSASNLRAEFRKHDYDNSLRIDDDNGNHWVAVGDRVYPVDQ